jgi:hypothetical protein
MRLRSASDLAKAETVWCISGESSMSLAEDLMAVTAVEEDLSF